MRIIYTLARIAAHKKSVVVYILLGDEENKKFIVCYRSNPLRILAGTELIFWNCPQRARGVLSFASATVKNVLLPKQIITVLRCVWQYELSFRFYSEGLIIWKLEIFSDTAIVFHTVDAMKPFNAE